MELYIACRAYGQGSHVIRAEGTAIWSSFDLRVTQFLRMSDFSVTQTFAVLIDSRLLETIAHDIDTTL